MDEDVEKSYKLTVNKLNKLYPERKHFNDGKGWYFTTTEDIPLGDFGLSCDVSKYSGLGVITECQSCKEKLYFPPVEKKIYDELKRVDFKITCSKCYRRIKKRMGVV